MKNGDELPLKFKEQCADILDLRNAWQQLEYRERGEEQRNGEVNKPTSFRLSGGNILGAFYRKL